MTVVKPDPNQVDKSESTTMQSIQQIANAIHPSIRVTVDYPDLYENKRVPILDLCAWIGTVTTSDKHTTQILHSYYRKEISSTQLIHRNSALEMKNKINILVADMTRIMRNDSQMLDEKEKQSHIQFYLDRMQSSGYSSNERKEVFVKARKKYREAVKREKEGKEPMYRPKNWNRKERERVKRMKRNTWYSRGGDETVMFVDATPGSSMAKEIRNVLKTCNLKIKVVERSGQTLKQTLVKSNPFRREKCGESCCALCSNTESNVDCKVRNIVYKIFCKECGDKPGGMYIGESSRSIGERFNEHWDLYSKQSTRSVLHLHMVESHGGFHHNIQVKIIQRFNNDAMLRQVSEAEWIRIERPELNRKDEWQDLRRSHRQSRV